MVGFPLFPAHIHPFLYADSRKCTVMKPSLSVQLRDQHMFIFGKYSPTDPVPNHLSGCQTEAACPDLLGGCQLFAINLNLVT